MISRRAAYYARSAPPAAVFALDHIAGVVHTAISLRRLLTSYTGPLCRISSSSGGTPFVDVYPDGDGYADDATILGLVPSGTVYVVTMFDQSGNGRDFAPVTAGQGLLVKRSGRWTYAMGYSTQSPARCATAMLTGSASHTMAILSTVYSDSFNSFVCPFGTPAVNFGCYGSDASLFVSANGFGSGGQFGQYANLTASSPYMQVYVRADASSLYDSMRTNGRLLTRYVANAFSYTSASLDAWGFASSAQTVAGVGLDFVVCDSALTVGEQQIWEGCAAHDWAAVMGSVALPSGHPYLSARP